MTPSSASCIRYSLRPALLASDQADNCASLLVSIQAKFRLYACAWARVWFLPSSNSRCISAHGARGRICCLQEMYYRHLYATVQPTLEQRCESWDNYCALFNIILTSSINMQVGLDARPSCFPYQCCQLVPAIAD